MKFEIDTTEKTVKPIGAVNISELTKVIEKIFGDDAQDIRIVGQNTVVPVPYKTGTDIPFFEWPLPPVMCADNIEIVGKTTN